MADRIVLRREDVSGNLAATVFGSSVVRVLLIYGILSLSFIGFAICFAFNGQIWLAILPFLFSFVLLRGILKSRHFSAIPEIPRDAIETIEIHEPCPGATRGYFLVHFRLGGTLKKRIIMLPGTMSGGTDEFKHALDVLRNHGLIREATGPNSG